MTQDLTGGYCPKCDTVWAAPGVCNCNIPYHNTKEGMHETAKLKNIKAWSLGCSCDECVKEFDGLLDKLPNPIDTSQNEMDKAIKTYRIVGIEKVLTPSVFEKEIWNEAIEAAALIGEEDHGSYCEEVGNKIRKLKK